MSKPKTEKSSAQPTSAWPQDFYEQMNTVMKRISTRIEAQAKSL